MLSPRTGLSLQQTQADIVEEIHTLRKEVSSYKNRLSLTQRELQSNEQEALILKKKLQNATELNQKLGQQNQVLKEKIDSLVDFYTNSVDQIKEEINNKQQEIHAFKEKACFPEDTALLRRQITLEVENQWSSRINKLEADLKQQSAAKQRLQREQEMSFQKYQHKIKVLEDSLKEADNRHMEELNNYARSLQQKESIANIGPKDLQKKQRKEIERLRSLLDTTQGELAEVLEDRHRIEKTYNQQVQEHMKKMQALMEQLSIYRNEYNKSRKQLELPQIEMRDLQNRERERDRQARKYREANQVLVQQLQSKEERLAQIIAQNQRNKAEIKKLGKEREGHNLELVERANRQKDNFTQEINYLRGEVNNQAIINATLQRSLEGKTTSPAKPLTDEKNEIFRESNQLLRHLTEKNGKMGSRVPLDNRKPVGAMEISPELKKSYVKQLEDEQRKVKQLALKYLEMKKKYEKAANKLAMANKKVVELLQAKINTKMNTPTRDAKQYGTHSLLKKTLHQPFLSPQPNQAMDFYQRSMQIRGKNMPRQLRCSNHDESIDQHEDQVQYYAHNHD